MEITINLKTVSTIVAIVVVIIIAILGLLGVYISKMDIRIAAIQYIILGLGLFIAIGYYG